MYKQTNPGFTRTEEIAFDNVIRMAEGSAYKAGAFIDKIKNDKNHIVIGHSVENILQHIHSTRHTNHKHKCLVNNFEVYFKR